MPLATFEVMSELDILIACGNTTNELALWSTSDGSTLHNIDMERFALVERGYEKVIGSNFIKENTNKTNNNNNANPFVIKK